MRNWTAATAALLAIALAHASHAATNVGGTITTNTTWSLSGSPYIVTSTLTIAAGATLTIAPQVEVKVNQSERIVIYGTLTAVGTASQPITFTANQATPTAGYWKALVFVGAGMSSSRLEYVTVSYGGQNNPESGWSSVYVDGGSPSFDHLTVLYSATAGVRVLNPGAAPTLTNSRIQGSAWSGVQVDAPAAMTVTSTELVDNAQYAFRTVANARLLGLTGLTLTGNGGGTGNGVAHYGGVVTGSETWLAGVDWYLVGTLQIGTPAVTTPSLTVSPGVEVKVGPSLRVVIYGTLTAVGTASQPIAFTSSQATPTAGYWKALVFVGAGMSNSRLDYVTVSYGGQNNPESGWSSVYVDGGSPSFDHLTVLSSATAGVRVLNAGAAPTLTNSRIQGSAWSGVQVDAPGAITITSTELVDNGQYAIRTAANARLLSLTGLTFTGNGGGTGNGVAHYGGVVTGSETWLAGADWYLLGYLHIGSPTSTTPSLTVSPGVKVKVDSTPRMVIYGTLTAAGTESQPITFTSNQASPTPGNWKALVFVGAGASNSRLSYVMVSYGGQNNAESGWCSVYVDSSSPRFDHLTITDSATWGIRAGNSPGLVVTSAAFARNASGGVTNFTPALPFAVRLSYWDAPSGPSGAGSGTGQIVSTGVAFEPWLTGLQSASHSITDAVPRNRSFNPATSTHNMLDFQTAPAGSWTLTYRNGGGAVIRSFSGSGEVGSVIWDGRDGAGSLMPSGTYSYELTSNSLSGPATPARGLAILDGTLQLAVSGTTVSEAVFSPNGDGVKDSTTLTATTNVDSASWTVTVRNGAQQTVRTATGTGRNIAFTWDGRHGSGLVAADGSYSETIDVTSGDATVSSAASVTLDNTPPSIVFTAPAQEALISNVHGLVDPPIRASVTDGNLSIWDLKFGYGTVPTSWSSTLARGWDPFVDQQIATFGSAGSVNGPYTFRISASDLAGNANTGDLHVNVGHFKLTLNVRELNAASGGTVGYTSTVPFPLTETLVIKDESGTVVKTVLSQAQRNTGSYEDPWNARNDAGTLQPDGPYFAVATVTAGSSTLTYDLTNQGIADEPQYTGHLPAPDWDPFNNDPYVLTFGPSRASRVRIFFSPIYPLPAHCDPPNYCPKDWLYEESGPHTYRWAGVDDSGALRPDLKYVGAYSDVRNFAANAVVAFGTKPTIANLHVAPPLFGPAVGTQALTFDLTSHQSQPCTVTVKYQNQASLSVLRTITLANTPPGHVTVTWDGRADNGMYVAPGPYTITVEVTDGMGNRRVIERTLTNVQY